MEKKLCTERYKFIAKVSRSIDIHTFHKTVLCAFCSISISPESLI
jgi:hypothetical protein